MGQEIDGVQYFSNVAHVVVYNNHDGGRTFDGVRLRSGTLETRECVDQLTGNKIVNLHSGEYAAFEIGTVVSNRMFGQMDLNMSMNEVDTFEAKHNTRLGHRSLRIGEKTSVVIYFGHPPTEEMKPTLLSIFNMSVTAKDHPATRIKLMIDHNKLISDKPDAGNPFSTVIES